VWARIFLPIFLCGLDTYLLELRKGHRLRVFENRVLGRIYGPKTDEILGGWRRVLNEELHNLHSPLSIIRMKKQRSMGFLQLDMIILSL
jgi:hypothetical protein